MSNEEIDEVNKTEEFQLLGRKIYAVTLKCTASLVFASIGAGVGSTMIRPSLGQWIGKTYKKHLNVVVPLT